MAERQLNDPYVAAARREGYRSRAAFKLIELDDRFSSVAARPTRRRSRLCPGRLDPGCGRACRCRWYRRRRRSAATRADRRCRAVARRFDRSDAATAIRQALGGEADIVLSDMAPATTGHAATDHLRILALAEAGLAIAEAILRPGGIFVAKVQEGGAEGELLARLKALLCRAATCEAAGEPRRIGGDLCCRKRVPKGR